MRQRKANAILPRGVFGLGARIRGHRLVTSDVHAFDTFLSSMKHHQVLCLVCMLSVCLVCMLFKAVLLNQWAAEPSQVGREVLQKRKEEVYKKGSDLTVQDLHDTAGIQLGLFVLPSFRNRLTSARVREID